MGNEASSILEKYDERSDKLLDSIKNLSNEKLGETNKDGNTTLMIACKNKIYPIATVLLKQINKCNISQINKDGDTVLIIACRNNMIDIALKILDNVDNCNLSQINKNGETAILVACKNRMSSVVCKMLKYIDQCNLSQVSNANETAILVACRNQMSMVVCKMLEHIDQCNLSFCTPKSKTSFMFACQLKMNHVVEKMLEYPDQCNLYHKPTYYDSVLYASCRGNPKIAIKILKIINKSELSNTNSTGSTPLMVACYWSHSELALEILKNIDYCELQAINKSGETALLLAFKNNLEQVAMVMLSHFDKCSLAHNKDKILSWAKINDMHAVIDIIEKKIDGAVDKTPIDNDLILERISKKTCIFCGDDTSDYILYSKCNHTLASCNNCTPLIYNKNCVICRSTGNEVKKVFLCI